MPLIMDEAKQALTHDVIVIPPQEDGRLEAIMGE